MSSPSQRRSGRSAAAFSLAENRAGPQPSDHLAKAFSRKEFGDKGETDGGPHSRRIRRKNGEQTLPAGRPLGQPALHSAPVPSPLLNAASPLPASSWSACSIRLGSDLMMPFRFCLPHSPKRSVEAFDPMTTGALFQMPNPTLAAEQAVADSRIADFAENGVTSFNLSNLIKDPERSDKRSVGSCPAGVDVSEREVIGMLQGLVVVQAALVGLTALVLPTPPPADFRHRDQFGPRAKLD